MRHIKKYGLTYLSISKSMLDTLKYNPNRDIIYHGTIYYDKNWGDQVNKYLIPALSGKRPMMLFHPGKAESNLSKIAKFISENMLTATKNATVYSAAGSVLGWLYNENSVVWGSGFLNDKARLPVEPKEILAVRGPLTADRINEQYGISVKVFGDPAVLYTKLYRPNITKKYSLGIIPHYVDYSVLKKKYRGIDDVLVIDIKSGNKKVIDDLLSCRSVASSSLHGLIMADAYDIPSTWMDWIYPKVDDFKYYDYFESIRCEKEPISVKEFVKPTDIISASSMPAHKTDMKKLLDVCPFYNSDISPIKIRGD